MTVSQLFIRYRVYRPSFPPYEDSRYVQVASISPSGRKTVLWKFRDREAKKLGLTPIQPIPSRIKVGKYTFGPYTPAKITVRMGRPK